MRDPIHAIVKLYPGASREALEAAYRLGEKDTKSEFLAKLTGDAEPPKAPIPRKPLTLENRKRAPRGLAKEMAQAALRWPATVKEGVTSKEVNEQAKDKAEKMVTVFAIKGAFQELRKEGICELRKGRWYPTR